MASKVTAALRRVPRLLRRIAGLPADTDAILNQLNGFENKLSLIDAMLKGLENKLSLIDAMLKGLENKLSLSDSPSGDVATALLTAGFLAQKHPGPRSDADPHVPLVSPLPHDHKHNLVRLSTLEPHQGLFPVWQQLFDNAKNYYFEDVEASASVWGHKFATLFGAYVGLHAQGRLLDVGCGINGKPIYLAGYPNHMIAGVEPLQQTADPGFAVVQGFNEFLPWPDGSFETVVSGTSLDHVLSVKKSLEEVRRVLVPQGRYLVWLASLSGADSYEPERTGFKPVDQFHLFHFDRKWIEPVFASYFEIQDVTIIPQQGFDHVFYSLSPKPT